MKEKNKYLIIGIMGLLVTLAIILFWGYIVLAQDVQTSITVEQGSLYQKVRFTGVEAIDDITSTRAHF